MMTKQPLKLVMCLLKLFILQHRMCLPFFPVFLEAENMNLINYLIDKDM